MEHWLLKTSFHPANSWTSSGLRENGNAMPYMGSMRFFAHAQNWLKTAWGSWVGQTVWGCWVSLNV